MKRILPITMILVLALAVIASAAEPGKKMPMTFGGKLGISLGNAAGDSLTSGTGTTKSMKAGFLFGGVFSFEVANGIAIQPELFYVQKGVKLTLGSESGKIKIDYLELPVLIKWIPQLKDSKIRPTVFAGPFLGLLLSSKLETPLGSEDLKDSTKSMDFGITFGGGIGYKMTKGELFLDARYDIGMSKIRKTASDGYADDTKATAIMIAVGYKFDI